MPVAGYEIHGYAVVSDDDMIADRDGRMPDALRNDADRVHLRSELDRARIVVLGRITHERSPNLRRRPCIVLTRGVDGLAWNTGAWWWNPATMPLRLVLDRTVPERGRIAALGGQGVFDLILSTAGFDAFHLTRIQGVTLPGGHAIFKATECGETVESVFRFSGLEPGPSVQIDPKVPIDLTVWRRSGDT